MNATDLNIIERAPELRKRCLLFFRDAKLEWPSGQFETIDAAESLVRLIEPLHPPSFAQSYRIETVEVLATTEWLPFVGTGPAASAAPLDPEVENG